MKCLFRRETFNQGAQWKGWVEQKQHNQKIYSLNLSAYEGRELGGAEEELWVFFVSVIAVKALWLQEAGSAPWDSADKWHHQEVLWIELWVFLSPGLNHTLQWLPTPFFCVGLAEPVSHRNFSVALPALCAAALSWQLCKLLNFLSFKLCVPWTSSYFTGF